MNNNFAGMPAPFAPPMYPSSGRYPAYPIGPPANGHTGYPGYSPMHGGPAFTIPLRTPPAPAQTSRPNNSARQQPRQAPFQPLPANAPELQYHHMGQTPGDIRRGSKQFFAAASENTIPQASNNTPQRQSHRRTRMRSTMPNEVPARAERPEPRPRSSFTAATSPPRPDKRRGSAQGGFSYNVQGATHAPQQAGLDHQHGQRRNRSPSPEAPQSHPSSDNSEVPHTSRSITPDRSQQPTPAHRSRDRKGKGRETSQTPFVSEGELMTIPELEDALRCAIERLHRLEGALLGGKKETVLAQASRRVAHLKSKWNILEVRLQATQAIDENKMSRLTAATHNENLEQQQRIEERLAEACSSLNTLTKLVGRPDLQKAETECTELASLLEQVRINASQRQPNKRTRSRPSGGAMPSTSQQAYRQPTKKSREARETFAAPGDWNTGHRASNPATRPGGPPPTGYYTY